MKKMRIVAGVVLMIASLMLWVSVGVDLLFLAWDGTGMYEDPVRDWSAALATYGLGHMLGRAGAFLTAEEK